MRSSQHNSSKRSRSRSRHRSSGSGGSSSGGNPLNRVYESNGPEMKVRGTAQTVADKYLQLARDAHASGDNVMAESFYQHAEHYLRILSAAQAYNQQFQQQQQQSPQQYRRPDDGFDDDDDEAGEGDGGEGGQPQPVEARSQYNDQQPGQPVSDSQDQPSSEGRDNQSYQSRSRDYNRNNDRNYDRNNDRNRSNQDNQRRDSGDRNRPPQPQMRNDAPPPTPDVQEEREPPAVQKDAPKESKEKWDGPQPSFLKRPPNGGTSSRSRTDKKPKREATEESAPPEDVPAK